MASAARLWAMWREVWRASRVRRGTAIGAIGVIGAIGTGTGKVGRLAVFPPIIARLERGTMSTGALGSTAGLPGKGRRAEDIDLREQRERVRKARKRKEGRQDGIATATKKEAEAIAPESEYRMGLFPSCMTLRLQFGKQYYLSNLSPLAINFFNILTTEFLLSFSVKAGCNFTCTC